MHPQDIWHGWPITQLPNQSDFEYGENRRKFDRAKKTNKEQAKALDILEKHEPNLVRGEPNICLSEDRIRFLLKELYKDCKGYAIFHRHNFFSKGLINGRKELEWRTPIPSPMIVLPRTPPLFTPEKYEFLKSLRILINKFRNSLADASFYKEESPYLLSAKKMRLKEVSAPQLWMGQFLFSAIVNGALLHKVWVNALMHGICEDVLVDESTLWLDLSHIIGEGESAVTLKRRWFPDPLTSALLIKILSNATLLAIHSGKAQNNTPDFYLNRFYASIGISSQNRPTLNQLISAAKTKLALTIPPYLISYAGSLNQSQSLPETYWYRFKYDVVARTPPEKPAKAPQSDRELPTSRPKLAISQHEILPDQLQKLHKLHSFFSSYHYKTSPKVGTVTKKIERFIAEGGLCGMLELLARWSLAMMRSKRLAGKKAKPSSMQTYLYAIAKELVVYGTELKPDELSSDDWDALFDKVRESSPSPQRLTYKNKRLREFNNFLVSTYNFPWVEIRINSNGDLRNIEANIISQEEYKTIKKLIQNTTTYPKRIRNIQSILISLGFRCGLRRKEALKIEMIDIQITSSYNRHSIRSVRPEIFIRANRYGTVKSHKSTRRLPLHLLLTKDELTELTNWTDSRNNDLLREKKAKAGALLFCNSGQDTTLLSTKETFDPIQQAIRLVTRDPTLTYHDLRHSFINIFLLNIIQDDLPETLQNTWNDIKDGKKGFAKLKSLRNGILLSPDIEPSRRFLYAVSLQCGHVDPKETLLTYLHILDWLLGVFVRKSKEVISENIQANLLGLNIKSLKVIKSRNGIKGDVTSLDILKLLIKRTKNLPMARHEEMVPIADVQHELKLEMNQYSNVALLLFQVFEKISTGTSRNEISEQYQVSIDEIAIWENTAKKIVKLTTPPNTDKSRLLTKPRSQAKSPKKTARKLFYPKKPHSLLDQQDATTICDNVIALYEQDNGLVVSGLQLYILKEDSSLPDISFSSDAETKLLTTFLYAAGIAKDRIMVSLYLINPEEKDQHLEYWSQFLDLEKENFNIIKGRYKVKTHPHGKTKIWVTNLLRSKWTRRAKHLQENQTRKLHTASGLRFALFMATVYLGILPENSSREPLP